MPAQRPPERADHARRHRVLESVRAADRDDDLTWPQRSRVAQHAPGQIASVGADNGDVRVAILADGATFEVPSVGQVHVDLRGVLDHMTVREDEAVGREDQAGSRSHPLAAAPLRRHVQFDDRRTDEIDGADHRSRVGIEQFVISRRFRSCHKLSRGQAPKWGLSPPQRAIKPRRRARRTAPVRVVAPSLPNTEAR